MIENDISINIDVGNADEVLAFAQQQLINISQENINPKEKISALSTLSRNALAQNRLKQDSNDSKMQQEISKAIFDALEKVNVNLNVGVTANRSKGFTIDLPDITPKPGEDSTIQEEFKYHDIIEES